MEKLKKVIMIVFVVGIFLVPVVSIAGDLEPSAAPAPTMKTLDQIPPTWSQKLPAAQRFELVFNGAAVLDKETGLVWEQSPIISGTDWASARLICNDRAVGNRKGWRLPALQELASLVDPSVPSPGPTLPAGHPFSNVQSGYYWSATIAGLTTSGAPNAVWSVYFNNAYTAALLPVSNSNIFFWCVRGGQGVSPQ